MKRRELVLGMVFSLAAPPALAQPRPVKVGMLMARANSSFTPVIVKRLAELGYRERTGMTLELRDAGGAIERFPKLARELIEAKCDVVFAIGTEHGARALRDARSSVPVVFLALDYDPLEKRLVDSLRRPQGNITGVYLPNLALVVKRLEIARDVLPGATRFLVLSDIFSKDQL